MMIPPALRSRAGGAPSVWRHFRRGDRYARRGHRLGPRTRPQWSGSPAGYGPEPIQEGPQELAHRPGRALETDRPGFKSAAGEELPKARAVMDPIPRRLPGLPASSTSAAASSRETTGRRGRAGDRLHRARHTLHTGADLLTDPQARHLEALFADERHAPVHAGWGVYQRLIQTYRVEDSGLGKHLMRRLIDCPEAGRLRRARGDQDTGQDPDRRSRRHPWPTLTTPASPTAPPKQLTAAWSPYAASPWDSETSLTTPSAASSTPDASKTTW